MLDINDFKDYVNTRKWLYASENGDNNKIIMFYYYYDHSFSVEESNGYGNPPTIIYFGFSLDCAITSYNNLIKNKNGKN
jgi:hypothetical protein